MFINQSYHAGIMDRDGHTLDLEADHRRHAEIENVIRDPASSTGQALKYDAGLSHLPSGRFAANAAWLWRSGDYQFATCRSITPVVITWPFQSHWIWTYPLVPSLSKDAPMVRQAHHARTAGDFEKARRGMAIPVALRFSGRAIRPMQGRIWQHRAAQECCAGTTWHVHLRNCSNLPIQSKK